MWVITIKRLLFSGNYNNNNNYNDNNIDNNKNNCQNDQNPKTTAIKKSESAEKHWLATLKYLLNSQ